jgi:hypothetical protein
VDADVVWLDFGRCHFFSHIAFGHGGPRHWYFGLGVNWLFDVHLDHLKSV